MAITAPKAAARSPYYLTIQFVLKYHPEASQQATECRDLAGNNTLQREKYKDDSNIKLEYIEEDGRVGTVIGYVN